MTKPLITTIITTYQRPALLKKAIQSVLNQSFSDFQVYVCDNASGDETAEIVAEFIKKDPRIHYFRHETNIGMIANYQFGLSLVNTDFFSFLSDDDVLLPLFYENVLQEFHRFPLAAFVAGSTILMKPNGDIVYIPMSNWEREGQFDPPEGFLELIGIYPIPTSILFSKKVLEHAVINEENALFWDCDYLLQVSSVLPFVICKKPCGIFRYSLNSHSLNQPLSSYETAFYQLENRILSMNHLPSEILVKARERNLLYLAKHCRPYFLSSLQNKKFDEALKIVELMNQCPDFQSKATLYKKIAKFLKKAPIFIYGIHVFYFVKSLVATLKNKKYKNYAHYFEQ